MKAYAVVPMPERPVPPWICEIAVDRLGYAAGALHMVLQESDQLDVVLDEG